MPRVPKVPSYRFHKARNCAVVTLDGKNHYLGAFGSADSHAAYRDKIAEWGRKKSIAPTDPPAVAAYTCGHLALDYLAFATGYYVKDGRPTSQIFQIRQALKDLVALYETEPAAEFGPVKLKNLQQHMIGQGRSRAYINKLIDCLKLAFKWAGSEELVPAAVHHALQTVAGLKKGRSGARETESVAGVDVSIVNATLEHLSRVVADMVRVQLLTGMRPGEVIILRPCDITRRTDGAWIYRPETHKTEHHGKDRCIFIGPEARPIVAPYLFRDAEAYCFSPAESVQQHHAAKRANRKTRLTPSQRARARKATPRRSPSARYTSASYRRAVERGCEVAFGMPAELRKPARDEHGLLLPETSEIRVEHSRQAALWRKANCWSPNQLRHTTGTLIRERFGLEAAQAVLGHSHANTTEIYAERNLEKAAEVMQQIG